MHLSEVLNCIAGAGGYHMHLVLGLLCNLHASRPIGTCFHALQSGMLPPTGVPGKFLTPLRLTLCWNGYIICKALHAPCR